MDQVGKERDAAAGREDDRLSDRRCPKHGQGKADCAQSGSRALDAFIDQPVGVATVVVVIAPVLLRRMDMRARVGVGVGQALVVAMQIAAERLV